MQRFWKKIETAIFANRFAVDVRLGPKQASEVGTKKKAIQGKIKDSYILSCYFGKNEVNKDMIDCETKRLFCFNAAILMLLTTDYPKKLLKFANERLPPISACIKQHIHRAYRQQYT